MFHLVEQRIDPSLRCAVNRKKAHALAWNAVEDGRTHGQGLDQRHHRQVFLPVHFEQAPAATHDFTDGDPQVIRYHPGRIPNPLPPPRRERIECVRIDRIVALRLQVDNADEGKVTDRDGLRRDHVTTRSKERELSKLRLHLRAGIYRSVALLEGGPKRLRENPRRMRFT